MEEYLSYDIQEIKQALLNFNQDNFKENSIRFFESLGYKSSKDISFIDSPNMLYNQLYQEGKVFDKNKVLFYRWKKCYGLFHYTTEELNNILQYHQLRLSEDYNQSYLFFAIELNGFHCSERDLKTISQEINKCFPIPIIILFKYFDKIALSITKRRKNELDNEKDVIEESVIRVKPYKYATDIDAKLFADLSIYNVLQTTKLIIQEQSADTKEDENEKIYLKDNTDFSIDVSKAVNRLMDESKYDDYDFEDEEERYSAYEHRILNDSIKWYFSKIGKYKLLTRERELELARHIINDGKITNEQEKEMILSNLKLVISIAKRYIPRVQSMEFEDLIQEGNIGLIKAVEHFDYTKGYKFSTYATWWIKQSISRALCDKNRLIRLPVHANETLYKINKFKFEYNRNHNSEPSIEVISETLKLKKQNVNKILELSAVPISIDNQIGSTDLKIIDMLEASIKYQPDYVINGMFYRYLIRLLLNKLKFKEFKIVCHRKGLLNIKIKTLEEVGAIYKVTRERIRQLEDRSFEKIKKLQALKDYRNYFLPQKPLDIKNDSVLFKKNGISYLPERTEIARKIYALYGIKIDNFREKYVETALLNGYSNKQLELIDIDELYKNLKNPPKSKVNFENVQPSNSTKLSIKDIVSVLVDLEPMIVNNDREFCKTFDEIALTEGYTEETLPSYWTILRAVYDYKKDKGIEPNKESSRTPLNYDLDLSNPILNSFSFEKMPTTKEIIRAILNHDIDLSNNDRKFCKLFDLIAIKNGYNSESLPKYWNIIRAIYDCKKEIKNLISVT